MSNTFIFFLFSRIQDVCIILAIIVVFLLFFNTYVFQAGLISLLIRKFKTTIIIAVVYLALSVGLHVWTMVSLKVGQKQNQGASSLPGFVRVLENLESHGFLLFSFPGALESHGILCRVMESHGKHNHYKK